MTTPAKSPLRYPGGKTRAIKQILPLLPPDITEFREPFVGGGSVFLAAKSNFESIQHWWVNDINYDLYCFWKHARNDNQALVKRVTKLKAQYTDGRELYKLLKSASFAQSDFEQAVRFFIMNRITFSGVMDSGGYSNQAFEGRFTDSSIQRLANVASHLQNVKITLGDYNDVLQQDGEKVFIFLDPPYWNATKSKLYGVKGDLHTGFDHERFADDMKNCPHRWLITYDDSPRIRDLFRFADIVEWQLQYGMNNYKQGKAAKGNELFIKNY